MIYIYGTFIYLLLALWVALPFTVSLSGSGTYVRPPGLLLANISIGISILATIGYLIFLRFSGPNRRALGISRITYVVVIGGILFAAIIHLIESKTAAAFGAREFYESQGVGLAGVGWFLVCLIEWYRNRFRSG